MTGDTVYVKRPHKYTALRTPDGDISAETKNSMISGQAKSVVQDHSTIALEWDAIDEALEMDQFDQIIAPAADELVTDVEVRLSEFMKNNSAHQLGTAGNPINKWSDISQIKAYTRALGFPSGTCYGSVNPYAIRNLADSIKGIFSKEDAMNAWEQAQIPNYAGGVRLFENNVLASHTVGAWDDGLTLSAAPTQTYLAGKDTFQTTITITGGDASEADFLKAGDVLQIVQSDDSARPFTNFKTRVAAAAEGGNTLNYTGTVASDVATDGDGNATIVLNGPAFFETDGQYNTVTSAFEIGDKVNVISGTASQTYVPNMWYHEQAFGCHSVNQKRLRGWPTKRMTKDGMQLRFVDYSDGDKNQNYMRIDVLPAFAVYNPLLAGKFFGE